MLEVHELHGRVRAWRRGCYLVACPARAAFASPAVLRGVDRASRLPERCFLHAHGLRLSDHVGHEV